MVISHFMNAKKSIIICQYVYKDVLNEKRQSRRKGIKKQMDVKMAKDVGFHDSCPVCKKRMKQIHDKKRKHLFYYCKKCKQKYRIDVIYPKQEIECPLCKGIIKIDKESLINLYGNAVFNYHYRKVKI